MTVSSLWDDYTWPCQKSGACWTASQSLSIIPNRMASCHERSAAAVTHFTCAAHICNRSGPHVPIMSVFLSKAAALFKLKMCYGRAPSCFLPFCPHTVKFPKSLLCGDIASHTQQPQTNNQQNPEIRCHPGPPPSGLMPGEWKSLPQPAESISHRATKWPWLSGNLTPEPLPL